MTMMRKANLILRILDCWNTNKEQLSYTSKDLKLKHPKIPPPPPVLFDGAPPPAGVYNK